MCKRHISIILLLITILSTIIVLSSCGYNCETCQDEGIMRCHNCNGAGLYVCVFCSGTGNVEKEGVKEKCTYCKGGKIDCPLCYDGRMDCPDCDDEN